MSGLRLLGALLAAAVGLLSLDVRYAGAARSVELTARASISSAVIDAQPSFDPALVDARAAASSVGTSSVSSVVWPSFLVDAFFFLYGFQSVERIALGIAQAGWPQGPQDAHATQSEALAANLNGVIERPVEGGASHARAREDDAAAEASAVAASLPGGVMVSGAWSFAAVDRRGAGSAVAEMRIDEIAAGPLMLRGLHARATATPDEARSELTVSSASVAGTAVELDGGTVRAPTRDTQALVDAALAASGIEVEVLPAEQGELRGVRISVPLHASEPGGGQRDIRLAFVFGDVHADALARDVATTTARPPAPPPQAAAPRAGGPPLVDAPAPHVPPAPAVPGVPATRVVRRIVGTAGVPAPPASARGAYAAFLVLAVVLLAFRPLVRQAARP